MSRMTKTKKKEEEEVTMACRSLFKINKLLTMKIFTRQSSGSTKWFNAITDKILDGIEENLIARQHDNNIKTIRALITKLNEPGSPDENFENLLQQEMLKLPNSTHPRIMKLNGTNEILNYNSKEINERCKEFSEISKKLNLFRMDHLSNFSGHKSYYLQGPLAQLEQALVQYAVDKLLKNDFQLVSVPDILPSSIIEACGMQTKGERAQVYKLESGECLSGTSEMALAGLYSNNVFKEEDLPIKVAAVSRCYRAETSGLQQEKGIYRVHQFTKVEMFSICTETQSEEILESFKDIQADIFKGLKLNFRLLDMPPFELGASAYQKYDIEAWMPGRKMFGEISSCSNCTDYQTKRLKIQYRSVNDNDLKYSHSVNGTAAAIPRLLIAIVESNQNNDGNIEIPDVLKQYTKLDLIAKLKKLPELKLVKSIQ